MSDDATEIGDHDPILFWGGAMLGVWIECECSWISASYYSANTALKAHARHVERVEA